MVQLVLLAPLALVQLEALGQEAPRETQGLGAPLEALDQLAPLEALASEVPKETLDLQEPLEALDQQAPQEELASEALKETPDLTNLPPLQPLSPQLLPLPPPLPLPLLPQETLQSLYL